MRAETALETELRNLSQGGVGIRGKKTVPVASTLQVILPCRAALFP